MINQGMIYRLANRDVMHPNSCQLYHKFNVYYINVPVILNFACLLCSPVWYQDALLQHKQSFYLITNVLEKHSRYHYTAVDAIPPSQRNRSISKQTLSYLYEDSPFKIIAMEITIIKWRPCFYRLILLMGIVNMEMFVFHIERVSWWGYIRLEP